MGGIGLVVSAVVVKTLFCGRRRRFRTTKMAHDYRSEKPIGLVLSRSKSLTDNLYSTQVPTRETCTNIIRPEFRDGNALKCPDDEISSNKVVQEANTHSFGTSSQSYLSSSSAFDADDKNRRVHKALASSSSTGPDASEASSLISTSGEATDKLTTTDSFSYLEIGKTDDDDSSSTAVTEIFPQSPECSSAKICPEIMNGYQPSEFSDSSAKTCALLSNDIPRYHEREQLAHFSAEGKINLNVFTSDDPSFDIDRTVERKEEELMFEMNPTSHVIEKPLSDITGSLCSLTIVPAIEPEPLTNPDSPISPILKHSLLSSGNIEECINEKPIDYWNNTERLQCQNAYMLKADGTQSASLASAADDLLDGFSLGAVSVKNTYSSDATVVDDIGREALGSDENSVSDVAISLKTNVLDTNNRACLSGRIRIPRTDKLRNMFGSRRMSTSALPNSPTDNNVKKASLTSRLSQHVRNGLLRNSRKNNGAKTRKY